MGRKRLVALCLFLIVVGCALFSDSNVSALDGQGLTVSPLRGEFEIKPGTLKYGNLEITNSTSQDMVIDLKAEEFRVINQSYDYAFTAESEVTEWVSFKNEELTLGANTSQVITYAIGVPLGAEPGGRYISIFVSTNSSGKLDAINTRQRIASMIYLNVAGEVTREGSLVSYTSPWMVFGNNEWSFVIRNSGTTHFDSRYSVVSQDLILGNIINKTDGTKLILPGSLRLVSGSIPLPQLPGFYKLIFNIGLGDTPSVVKVAYYLYLPLWFVLLVGILILILLIRRIRKNQSVCGTAV